MMVTSEMRQGSVAWGSAPVYVYCLRPGGSLKEVSAQLFGSTPMINTNYAAVGDFNGDGIDDVVFIEFWDGQLTQGDTISYMSNPNGTYTRSVLPSAYGISVPAGTAVDGVGSSGVISNIVYGITAVDVNNDGCLDVVAT